MPLLSTAVALPKIGSMYPPRLLTFRGGLNNSVSDEFIADHELSAARNYIPDIFNAGVIIKREGVTQQSSVQTEAATSVHSGKHANYFSTSTTIRNFAGTSLASGLASTTEPDWTTFANNDIYVNGTVAPQTSTNGTTFAALGGAPPTFKYIENFNNFLFGAGHSGGILRWADLGTVATWTAGNSYTITNDQLNPITGLQKFHNVLVVFCQNTFHHITGFNTPDIGINFSNFEEGCTSHRSIVRTPFGLFWWTNSGLALSRDGFSVEYPAIKKIPNTLGGLNKAYYSLVHGVWNQRNKRVEFFVHNGSAQTTVNMRIDYYYEEDTFWVHDGKGVETGASGFAVISGEHRVFVGSAGTVTPYLFRENADVATDDGTPISAYAETKRDAEPGGYVYLKRSRNLTLSTVLVGNATLDLGVYVDNSDTLAKTWTLSLTSAGGFILDVDLLDVGILGAGVASKETSIGFNRRYNKLKYRIFDSNALRTRLRSITQRGWLVAA